MSWRIKMININHRTGSVAVHTLKRRYANATVAQATARQLCANSSCVESRAVAFTQGGEL